MTEETLKLKCPHCGGGLNLKRIHLGITGTCVHCHAPITAVETNGQVSVLAGRPPLEETHSVQEIAAIAPIAPETAPAPVSEGSSWGFPAPSTKAVDLTTPDVPEMVIPPLASEIPRGVMPAFFDVESTKIETFPTDRAEQEEFAEPDTAEPDTAEPDTAEPDTAEPDTAEPDTANATSANATSAAALKEQGIEFSHRTLSPKPAEERPASSLFGVQSDSMTPLSSLFNMEEPAAEMTASWGTKVPQENHASISPFSTGSADGGGFAETLFREKVEKNSGMGVTTSALFRQKEDAPAAIQEERCGERTILDGDGRPMKPSTKEEEEQFAKQFFAIENARNKPNKWMKRAKRFLIFLVILGSAGTGLYFFTPQEKLAQWKTNVYNWLEPGMAILDYLPEGLRPAGLPRSSFGIDAGVDENGVPKKKLNAFEGLKQLNVDIDKYRGSAETEMNALKDIK